MRNSIALMASGVLLTLLIGCGGETPPPASDQSAPFAPRSYPSLPGAMSEPPAWIGTNTPFDVEEFFESPASQRNAAPLYLDALFEFSSDVGICFGPLEQGPPGETRRREEAVRQRDQEHVSIEEAWQRDASSVNDAQVEAWLGQYETGFDKLAAAQQRPECLFETGVGIAALFPHAHAARQVARVIKWRTRRDLAQGDVDRPIRDVEMVLRLSRDIQPRGGTICQHVSVAVDIICCQDIVPQILEADGIDTGHCDRLLAAVGQHKVGSTQRFTEAVRAEYITAQKALYDLQYHTGDFAPKAMEEMGWEGPVDSPLACMRLLISLEAGGNGPLAQKKYGKGGTGLTSDHPLVAGWAANGRLMSDDEFAKEVDAINRVYASILKSAEKTTLEMLLSSRDETIVEPLRATNVAVLFEPVYVQTSIKALLEAEAVLRGTQCLIALRRWQLDRDGPASNLEAIVEAAGMSEVPTDPYSDQPMLMTIVGGQPVIYSVGLDGKDDRALVEWNRSAKNPKGDLLFRLPAPP